VSTTLSTHVLDVAAGRPAAGISVVLHARDGEGAGRIIGALVTNLDGRTDVPLATDLEPGMYEIVFSVGEYFATAGVSGFYDTIPIRFRIDADVEKYHVPLLLSPWGYSTYRGS
jgi:5-hydroxyisourate hydrolase